MKKIILLLIFILSCSVIFIACDDYSTPQKVYTIGREYTFGDTLKLKTENDVENEQFIITYTNLDMNDNDHYFSFEFHIFNGNSFVNDSIFEYTDSFNNEITFTEGRYYNFADNNILFFISYKNATEEIKVAINNNTYFFNACGKSFSP